MSTTALASASSSGTVASAKRRMPLLSPRACFRASPNTMADVFDGVVRVDVGVPGGFDFQVDQRMLAERRHHVIVERHGCVDVGFAGSVEVQFSSTLDSLVSRTMVAVRAMLRLLLRCCSCDITATILRLRWLRLPQPPRFCSVSSLLPNTVTNFRSGQYPSLRSGLFSPVPRCAALRPTPHGTVPFPRRCPCTLASSLPDRRRG